MRQPTKRRCSFNIKIHLSLCLLVTQRHRIHNTLIVVDWYLRLMGNKTIPSSREPRLESLYAPFVAGIDLPHQGVVDYYKHNYLSAGLCIDCVATMMQLMRSCQCTGTSLWWGIHFTYNSFFTIQNRWKFIFVVVQFLVICLQ